MLTGDLRNGIDGIWNSFWTGGISSPLEVMEQITCLLFIRRLDELQTLAERKAARLGRPVERRIFPGGADPKIPCCGASGWAPGASVRADYALAPSPNLGHPAIIG